MGESLALNMDKITQSTNMFEYLKYCRAPKFMLRITSDFEMAVCITKRPLQKKHMVALAKNFKFSELQSAEFLGLSLRQYRGMQRDTSLSTIGTEMVLNLSKLFHTGLQIFDDQVESLLIWLNSEVGALNKSRPIEIIQSKAGVDIVVALLWRMEYSVLA
jgi:uncharacterized protein (DUF2384 family)